ncbi:MAG: response regulator receiver protein [Candidatus Binatus sp.]|jgi:CheY-like chemotaxis protein|nr:response regulator receiver protein [Candidatus Binatus sp.]
MEKNLKAPPKAKKILIVDDEFGILEVLEFILIDAGFSVTSALNGQEALARLEESVPDLVIVDFMMPILDGHGVITAIRSDKRFREIPVILTSALPEKTIRERTDGFNAFIRKPYKTERLLEEIERALDISLTDPSK